MAYNRIDNIFSLVPTPKIQVNPWFIWFRNEDMVLPEFWVMSKF